MSESSGWRSFWQIRRDNRIWMETSNEAEARAEFGHMTSVPSEREVKLFRLWAETRTEWREVTP